MNRVILMGRLTRDPEIRYSQGERSMTIAKYTLAVDRRGRRNQDNDQAADFINCVAFDRAGEFAEKYFRQGMRVLVSGRLQTGSYVNKEGFSFPVLYDQSIDAATTYSVYSLPTTYFIDKDGYLTAQASGAIDGETLQKGIDMIYVP